MHDCIEDQGRTTALVLANAEAGHEQLRRLLRERPAPRRILVLATGSSMNAAAAMRLYLQRVARVAVTMLEPSTFEQYGTTDRDIDLIVAVSQRGRSSSTLDAVAAARALDAPIVALTAEVESPLAQAADVVVPFGCGDEAVLYSTVGVTATMLSVALIALEIAEAHGLEVPTGLDRSALEDVVAAVQGVLDRTRDALDAGLVTSAGRVMVLGAGPNESTAEEAATKIIETCRIPVQGAEVEAYMHGPIFELRRAHTVLLLEAADAPATGRIRQLDRFLRRHCDHVLTITTGEPREGAMGLGVQVHDLLSPVLLVIPVQRFAWLLSQHRGIDLDAPELEGFDTEMATKVR